MGSSQRHARLKSLRTKLDTLIQHSRSRQSWPTIATIVKDEFDQVYTKAGGSGMNAFTSYDLTCYFITCHRINWNYGHGWRAIG